MTYPNSLDITEIDLLFDWKKLGYKIFKCLFLYNFIDIILKLNIFQHLF